MGFRVRGSFDLDIGGVSQNLRHFERGWPDFHGKQRGMVAAPGPGMAGVKRYEDLHVWKLSVTLRDAIFTMTETGKVAKDFKFRDQIRDDSSSPARNIAEGFGRYRPKSFANFVRIARGSLLETRTLLQEGQSKKYFTAAEVTPLLRLQARAAKAAARLIQYLESCPDDFDPSSPPLPD